MQSNLLFKFVIISRRYGLAIKDVRS